MRKIGIYFGGIIAIALIGLIIFKRSQNTNMVDTPMMTITSLAFSNNNPIPDQYTCNGKNVNPPLVITGVPKTAKSLALVVDDPDAPMGTWVHWVIWNIPPEVQKISENRVPEGAEGTTSFGKPGYGGPCPPFGTHRYFFRLYALDTKLNLMAAGKAELERAMQGHTIEEAELVGLYSHKP